MFIAVDLGHRNNLSFTESRILCIVWPKTVWAKFDRIALPGWQNEEETVAGLPWLLLGVQALDGQWVRQQLWLSSGWQTAMQGGGGSVRSWVQYSLQAILSFLKSIIISIACIKFPSWGRCDQCDISVEVWDEAESGHEGSLPSSWVWSHNDPTHLSCYNMRSPHWGVTMWAA